MLTREYYGLIAGAGRSPRCGAVCKLTCPGLSRSMRNTLKDTNIAAKIDASDKERLEKMVEDAIEWLDHNQARPHLEFVR